MTQEQKDIILHGSAFEMMNACINFDNGTVDREKMLKAMHRYADMYHRNELSKLHQHTVISSVCEPCKYRFAQDYHGKMRCRDCQQGSNFEQNDL